MLPNDLIESSEELSNLAEEVQEFGGREFFLADKFKGHPDKSMVVNLSLTAMSIILESDEIIGWSKRVNAEKSHWVSEPVWEAAESDPLIFSESVAYFDVDSFLNYVITNASVEGEA